MPDICPEGYRFNLCVGKSYCRSGYKIIVKACSKIWNFEGYGFIENILN
jgi:hypothetical protein